jgi:hypothetical protein
MMLIFRLSCDKLKIIMSNTTAISLRDFRNNAQEIIEAVGSGKTFTIFKRSKPVLKLSKPTIDEWGDRVSPNDVSIDFREDGISVNELMDALRENLRNTKNER